MATQISMIIIGSFLQFRTISGDFESRVVGGQLSKIEDFAHSVFLSIECQTEDDDRIHHYACGSSILNQIVLLTAAHCFDNCLKSSFVYAYLGNSYRRKGTKIKAQSYRLHERYDLRRISNDIALVALKQTIQFSNSVKRIVLMENPPYREPAVIAGWGLTDEAAKKSSLYLKDVRQTVLNYEKCLRLIRGLPVGTICGGKMYSTEYPAKGDSGSALVVRQFIQIGIVSFKVPKFSKSILVYTDVGHYYNWIQKKVEKLVCEDT